MLQLRTKQHCPTPLRMFPCTNMPKTIQCLPNYHLLEIRFPPNTGLEPHVEASNHAMMPKASKCVAKPTNVTSQLTASPPRPRPPPSSYRPSRLPTITVASHESLQTMSPSPFHLGLRTYHFPTQHTSRSISLTTVLHPQPQCVPARTVAHQLDKARGYDYRRHAVIDPSVHTCGRPTT